MKKPLGVVAPGHSNCETAVDLPDRPGIPGYQRIGREKRDPIDRRLRDQEAVDGIFMYWGQT